MFTEIKYRSSLTLTTLLFILHFSVRQALEIKLNSNNNFTLNVFQNDTLQELFKYQKNYDISDCSPKLIYYEFANTNSTQFQLSLNDKDKIEKVIAKSSNKIIKTNFTFAENKENNNTFYINVSHFCVDEEINEKYWGIVEVEIYSSLDTMDKIKFEFVKFCKPPELIGSIITAIVLFLMSTLFVSISTYSEMSIELTDFKNEGEIKYWHGIMLITVGSLILVLIFYFVEYINIIFTILICLQISMAFYLTMKTFYEFLGFHINRNFTKLNKKIYDMEIYSAIIAIITIMLVVIYLVTKNWVLNNLFGFCLVFTILSLFHIRSFKICAIILISAFLYDVFWVYISPYLFQQNVMVVAATSLNLPIKLEIPIFMDNHPLKSCMFLGLGDLVLPGFILKFCHRFDFLKNSNVYYISSIILYLFALFLSGVVIALFNYPQPVLFYMCPILLIGISTIAYKRGEWEIWNANLLEDNLQVFEFNLDSAQIENNHHQYNITGLVDDLESKNDLSFTTEMSDSNSSDEK